MAKSLAEKLAKLANPAPEDFDPEDIEHHSNAESSGESDVENGKRAHYVEVGRSALRSDNIDVDKKKYGGSRVSRSQIEQDGSDESEEDEDEESEDEEELSEDEENSEEVSEEEEESEAEGISESESEEEASEEESESEEEIEPASKSAVAAILKKEQKQLVSRLSESANADIEKGRAVQAQMTIHENLLDLRIRLQKVLTMSNNLMNETVQQEDEMDAQSKLLQLAGKIATLRTKLGSTPIESSKKRSFESYYSEAEEMDRELAKQRESTLQKWSRKVQLSSGAAALQTQKFKSLNQSAAVQVTSVLADMPRLKARTQLNRSGYKVRGEAVEESDMLFDDSDFYRILLKELVDRRMADSGNTQGLKWTATKSTKVKKNVDTKASKGRKLRYHVQEKVQGFDAPRPVFKWSEEQVADLFANLLGQRITMDDAEPESGAEDEAAEVEMGDFALFA